MKGIILAGGEGSRLRPLTKITNKHLLPVYKKPMIYYSLELLVCSGLTEIMLVTGGQNAGDFLRLLGDGNEFGVKQLIYTYQEKPGGIAQALSLCGRFAAGEKFVVCLADNILEYHLKPVVERFASQPEGAHILLTQVSNLSSYGVPVFENGRIVKIEEKPSQPKSNLAVMGVYMMDSHAFEVIPTLVPSSRGELEITDLVNWYVSHHLIEYSRFDGFWGDCGESIDSWLSVNNMVRENGANKEPRPC